MQLHTTDLNDLRQMYQNEPWRFLIKYEDSARMPLEGCFRAITLSKKSGEEVEPNVIIQHIYEHESLQGLDNFNYNFATVCAVNNLI
jgi:hypothetical protein